MIRNAIRSFLVEQSGGDGFRDEDDLVKTGVVQSIRLIELIDFVAERFGVEVEADDIYRGRLASVDAIVRLVEEKRQP